MLLPLNEETFHRMYAQFINLTHAEPDLIICNIKDKVNFQIELAKNATWMEKNNNILSSVLTYKGITVIGTNDMQEGKWIFAQSEIKIGMS